MSAPPPAAWAPALAAVCLALSLAPPSARAAGPPAPIALDLGAAYRPANYAFLREAVGRRTVVQLGESLHITDEFVRARLHLLRYLHEEMGFDLVTFEGSTLDAWLGQEAAYDAGADAPARLQQAALFSLWQTAPMRDVAAYVVATQKTERPLYLTSFDVQPGTSAAAYLGAGGEVIRALAAALAAYGAPPDAGAAARWEAALAPAFRRYGATSPLAEPDEARARQAIDELERWVAALSPAVAAARPKAHAEALRLLPDNLRDALDLVQTAGRAGDDAKHVYRATRDGLAARNVVRLRDRLSASGRVVTWAHHSHVHHNATGRNVPSMGQTLLALAGDELYTIGLFAGGGRAGVLDERGCAVLDVALPPAPAPGAERTLLAHAGGDYFVDLARLDPASPGVAPWFDPAPSRQEPDDVLATSLARDFHGAIFVRDVRPPVAHLVTGPACRPVDAAPPPARRAWWLALAPFLVMLGWLARKRRGPTPRPPPVP